MKTFAYFILILSANIGFSEEISINPKRTPSHNGALEDIWCHAPQETLRYYQNPRDRVNCGHECNHSVNARIRNENLGKAGFYLGYGKALLLAKPKGLTLRDVARSVPNNQRCHLYSLYLVKSQAEWNDHPLFILDELNSYTAGCRVAADYKLTERFDSSYNSATKLIYFMEVVLDKLNGTDYTDYEELKNAVEWHKIKLEEYRSTIYAKSSKRSDK